MASSKGKRLKSGPLQQAFKESKLPENKSNHLNLKLSKKQLERVLENKITGKDIWFEDSETLHECLEEVGSTGWKKMRLNAWMMTGWC